MSQFFELGGQSVGTSASASIPPMNIQGWRPLRLTGLISLQSKRFSRVFSNTTIQKYQFFSTQPSSWSNSHNHTNCQCRKQGFNPWVGKIPQSRKWQPTPVVLPGKSHGDRRLASYSPWGNKESDTNLVTKQQMSRRITSTAWAKVWVFLGSGTPPTLWTFIVCPRTIRYLWVCI